MLNYRRRPFVLHPVAKRDISGSTIFVPQQRSPRPCDNMELGGIECEKDEAQSCNSTQRFRINVAVRANHATTQGVEAGAAFPTRKRLRDCDAGETSIEHAGNASDADGLVKPKPALPVAFADDDPGDVCISALTRPDWVDTHSVRPFVGRAATVGCVAVSSWAADIFRRSLPRKGMESDVVYDLALDLSATLRRGNIL